jgi:glutathione peroxidase-family protein
LILSNVGFVFVLFSLIIVFSGIKWNFTKFIVDKNGQPAARYAPTTDPFVITEIT